MGEEVGDDFDDGHEGEDVVVSCIRQVSSTHFSVIRYAFSQLEQNDDQRRTAIFQMFTKIRDKNCKVIVDGEKCINAVSSKVIDNVELKVVPYPNPYNVSWINSTASEVK